MGYSGRKRDCPGSSAYPIPLTLRKEVYRQKNPPENAFRAVWTACEKMQLAPGNESWFSRSPEGRFSARLPCGPKPAQPLQATRV